MTGIVPGLVGLRAWALGCRADEAAVELLARLSVDGWCVSPLRSWVRPCPRPGWYWLDGHQLTAQLGALPVRDQPIAALAALLTGSPTADDLGSLLAEVPAQHRAFVRAALTYVVSEPPLALVAAA